MCFSKRTCTDGNIFDSHIMNLFHDHIYHKVSLTEMMMKADCHSVFDSTFYKHIMNAVYKLASIRIDHTGSKWTVFAICISVKMMYSLKYFFPCLFQDLFRDISAYCINHFTNPPYIRLKLLQVQWFSLHHHRMRCRSFYRLL